MKQAETWARKVEHELDVSHFQDPGADMKVTVRKLFERFRDEACPSRKGGKWETVRIERLLRTADFSEMRLSRLRAEDLRDWRDSRLKEISGPSVNREMNLISGIFTHAIKEWGIQISQNPMRLVGRPKDADKKRTRRWTQNDIDRVLAASNFNEATKPRVGRDYVGWAVLIAIETAMRLGELCLAKISDFDPNVPHIMLHDTKNGDTRAVPLSRRALSLVTKLVEGRKQTEKIIPLGANSLGLYYREARNKAGVKDLHFHDTRHEAATRLSQKLTNVLELSAVTGHRSLQSLRRYYHPDASDLAKKLD